MMRLLFILCLMSSIAFGQGSDKKASKKYQELIAKADEYFSVSDFNQANKYYEEAVNIFPAEQYPKDQIYKCREYMKSASISDGGEQFIKILTTADEYFNNCRVDQAYVLYEKAHKMQPSDPRPVQRMENLENVYETYERYIEVAEIEWDANNLLLAYSALSSATKLMPCDSMDAKSLRELKMLIEKTEITVSNVVLFERYMDYTMADSVNSIKFKVVITNNSKEKIPDLGVTSRSENLSFYVNGELSNPISLYNGMEALEGEKVIKPKDSAEYYVSWTLTPDSGIVTHYGNEFTVHWEYFGIKSEVISVNIKEMTSK